VPLPGQEDREARLGSSSSQISTKIRRDWYTSSLPRAHYTGLLGVDGTRALRYVQLFPTSDSDLVSA